MVDRSLDKLFKDKLENREFEFKNTFWNEMEETIETDGEFASENPSAWNNFIDNFFKFNSFSSYIITFTAISFFTISFMFLRTSPDILMENIAYISKKNSEKIVKKINEIYENNLELLNFNKNENSEKNFFAKNDENLNKNEKSEKKFFAKNDENLNKNEKYEKKFFAKNDENLNKNEKYEKNIFSKNDENLNKNEKSEKKFFAKNDENLNKNEKYEKNIFSKNDENLNKNEKSEKKFFAKNDENLNKNEKYEKNIFSKNDENLNKNEKSEKKFFAKNDENLNKNEKSEKKFFSKNDENFNKIKSISCNKIENNFNFIYEIENDSILIEKNKKEIKRLQNSEFLTNYRFAGFIFGCDFSQNFNNKNEFSTVPVFGLQYENSITKKFKIITNVLYFNKNVNTKKEFEKLNYDFGSFSEKITIQNKKLHYLELPIFLQTKLSDKNFIDFGFSYSHLLTTSSDIKIIKTDYFGEKTENKFSKNGYMNAFENNDFSVLLAYEFLFYERFKAILRFNYGLKDITKNNYFENEIINKNINFKILISYNLY